VQMVQTTEPLRPPQKNARLHAVPAVDVEQFIGEQTAHTFPGQGVGAVALAEVGGELEAVLVLHRCTPIARPSAAADRAQVIR
jgi:sortase (surface protein transpeptidase)